MRHERVHQFVQARDLVFRKVLFEIPAQVQRDGPDDKGDRDDDRNQHGKGKSPGKGNAPQEHAARLHAYCAEIMENRATPRRAIFGMGRSQLRRLLGLGR